jgi:PadR family transcriptional regulator PadR
VKKTMDVMQGTLDLIILKALSSEPAHGWGIIARIAEMSHDVFQLGQGSLYPALHRFEKRGWVDSHWHTTANNRIARYYQLSADGRRALVQEMEAWRNYVAAMDAVIAAGGE